MESNIIDKDGSEIHQLTEAEMSIAERVAAEVKKDGLKTPFYDIVYNMYWDIFLAGLSTLSQKEMRRVLVAILELHPDKNPPKIKGKKEDDLCKMGNALIYAKAFKLSEDEYNKHNQQKGELNEQNNNN